MQSSLTPATLATSANFYSGTPSMFVSMLVLDVGLCAEPCPQIPRQAAEFIGRHTNRGHLGEKMDGQLPLASFLACRDGGTWAAGKALVS